MQSQLSVQMSSFSAHSSSDTSHLQPWEPDSSKERQPGMKSAGAEHLAWQSAVKKAESEPAEHSSRETSQSHMCVSSS